MNINENLKNKGNYDKKKHTINKLIYLSIYLHILPYALTDILGRCAVEQKRLKISEKTG